MNRIEKNFKKAKKEFNNNYRRKYKIKLIKKAKLKLTPEIDGARTTMLLKIEYGKDIIKENDEIQKAILIHELGHIYGIHSWIIGGITMLTSIFILYISYRLAVLQPPKIENVIWGLGIFIGGLLILLMIALFFCRLAEYNADKYVKKLGYEEVFIKYLEMNGNENFDNIFKEIISRHPSNKNRIKKLKNKELS